MKLLVLLGQKSNPKETWMAVEHCLSALNGKIESEGVEEGYEEDREEEEDLQQIGIELVRLMMVATVGEYMTARTTLWGSAERVSESRALNCRQFCHGLRLSGPTN